MKLDFIVHSVNQEDFAITAQVDGKAMDVKVSGAVVELVSAGGSMSPMIKVVPDDMAKFLEEFAVGRAVEMTLKTKES